ncbi:MAG: metallophosphoesterase [Alphaproteobacteria bacterium]|nr:metallophosphoesterase [Alphaproteobacteria bacterium]
MSDLQINGGEVTLVHSSDLHVDDGRIAAQHGGDGTGGLRAVLAFARRVEADAVILAGDTFDNHMVTGETVERAGRLLAEAGPPVVLLPGNHDPLTADSVYARGGYGAIPGLHVLGLGDDGAVRFERHGLEIWGNPHRDYRDMAPLQNPRPRTTRWQICIGHGHYEPPETWHDPLRPSWLISDAAIAATGADYVALGHWDRPAQVGDGRIPAFYSGSPDWAKSVNLVRLHSGGEVAVTRAGL